MAELFAEFEGSGEALAGELGFFEANVSETTEVEAVGLAPGVSAIGGFGEVEGFAGVLEGLLRFRGGEVGFSEGEAEVDGEFSEAAGVGEEDAGFGFGDGLGVVAEVTVEFGGGVEAAQLELDLAGAVGKGAGFLKVLGGLGGIIWEEEAGEEGVAAADVGVPVVADADFLVG